MPVASNLLGKAAAPVTKNFTGFVGTRVKRHDIISETLCGRLTYVLRMLNPSLLNSANVDDILKRLAPSLKRHVGCDIIDINPGFGLFSSKLHKLLRPRTHILAEPLMRHYSPYLKPVIQELGPAVKVLECEAENFDSDELWKPDIYIASGLLSGQDRIRKEAVQQEREERNDSLLVLANTAHVGNRKHFKLGGSLNRIYNYLRSLQEGSGFHTNGGVRLLLWMPDKQKVSIVPRCLYFRKTISVLTELLCHTEEITGDANDSGRQRDEDVEYRSSQKSAAFMKKQGIHIASNRLASLPRQIQETQTENVDNNSNDPPSPLDSDRNYRSWHRELLDLEKGFADGRYSAYVGGLPGLVEVKSGKPSKEDMGRKYTPEYARYTHLRRDRRNQRKKEKLFQDLAREKEEIAAMETSVQKGSNLSEDDRKAKIQELHERNKLFMSKLDDFNEENLAKFQDVADNRRAFLNNPPLLLWDQRTAEPMIAENKEFHPANSTALLDFQPRPLVKPKTQLQKAYLKAMLNSMFVVSSQSVVSALDSMALGAAEALTPHAPSLHDPDQGGAHDLAELRVRMITPKMLEELMVAWEKWPFAPHPTELDMLLPDNIQSETYATSGRPV
ncbi:hypothetical protein MMC14_007085 [Varicellaria rhodocarpa]|nr:hypothetical protein [Varicellaria rhodocarpa]